MIELQDIFTQFGRKYRNRHFLTPHKIKTMTAIERCRTADLGGHVDECDSCGYTKISYNSCRNRHCPKCQTLNKLRWLEDRKKDLLPVQYFHVVFTLPDAIHSLALQNQRVVYSILFKAASKTLLELAADPKFLGAKIGFTSLLHTWSQNLMHHPHIHCIVPGGGLSTKAFEWISSKRDFFIPIRVLSRVYRGKFLAFIKQAYKENELSFHGQLASLNHEEAFLSLVNSQYDKEWVVYCKPPFSSPAQVLEYISHYTHRVAITNNRIVGFHDDQVTFKWRDYSDGNKNKLMTLNVEEFIRRFMLHVLPPRFVKIRHYGLFCNRTRRIAVMLCCDLLGVNMSSPQKLTTHELINKILGIDTSFCPSCRHGRMLRRSLRPEDLRVHSPPMIRKTA